MDPKYPEQADFWMNYGENITVIPASLMSLTPTVSKSMKSFVQKRGGARFFGPLKEAQEILGGVVPVSS